MINREAQYHHGVFRVPHHVWIGMFLVVAVFLVYGQVAHHSYVLFDDPLYVTENSIVQNGLTPEGLYWAFTSVHASNWHPITWISHMMDVALFNLHPGGHHLTNVAFHAINSLLLFALFHKMTAQIGPSALIATFFALHPFHVESVAWISERKDVLSTFFWMLAIGSYVRFVQTGRYSRYGLALLFFILGLMSKPMVVTLPFVLLLLDVWPLERLRGCGSGQGKKTALATLVREKTPFFALSVASSVITVVAQHSDGAISSLETLPISVRAANAVVAYAAYAGKMLWPSSLSVIYPFPAHLPWWHVGSAVLTIVAVSFVSIKSVDRRPYLFVGWFWFLGTLVPVIGIIQVGLQAMADRYTYVPLIGLFICTVWGGREIGIRLAGPRTIGAAVAGIILALAVISHHQVTFWKDSYALFERALAVTWDNYPAHTAMGNALAADGRYAEAVQHYQEAVRIQPGFDEARINLSLVLLKLGVIDQAQTHFGLVAKPFDHVAEFQFNMGNALLTRNRVDEAMEHYSNALDADPLFADAHNNMGLALVLKNRLDRAIFHFQKALQLQPDFSDARANLQRAVEGKRKGRNGGDRN